jgi:hypothetical protein
MAKGRSCDVCRQRMAVKREDRQPKGSWVTYECANNACKNYVQSGHKYRFSAREFEDNGR